MQEPIKFEPVWLNNDGDDEMGLPRTKVLGSIMAAYNTEAMVIRKHLSKLLIAGPAHNDIRAYEALIREALGMLDDLVHVHTQMDVVLMARDAKPLGDDPLVIIDAVRKRVAECLASPTPAHASSVDVAVGSRPENPIPTPPAGSL